MNEGTPVKSRQGSLSLTSFGRLSNLETSIENLTKLTSTFQPSQYPQIRETSFGQALRFRCQVKDLGSGTGENAIGPPDLIHVARYFGIRSAQYTNNDFTIDPDLASFNKDDEGYIGHYHFLNGIGRDNFLDEVEQYICNMLGLYKRNEEFFFTKHSLNTDTYSTSKREIVVTYCSYNILNKSDFRARFVVHMNGTSKKIPVQVDRSFQIITYAGDRKNMTFNATTIKDLQSNYWEELSASQIIRLFNHLDNPSQQLTGLVSYHNYVDSKTSILSSVQTLVKFLGRGNLTGTKVGYGTATNCSSHGDSSASGNSSLRKTNSFRNFLIDTLLRLCQLDVSGETCEFAISQIHSRYYTNINEPGDWDVVILQIFKVTLGCNKEREFLNMVHRYLSRGEVYTTQLGLILLEQVKFLITKKNYDLALKMAQKCVSILPLDFECWYNLALCYCLIKDFENALLTINSMPIILNNREKTFELDVVAGMKDFYMTVFSKRLGYQDVEVISEKTFYKYFPNPKTIVDSKEVNHGFIKKIWTDLFLFNSYHRHPINGNYWYQSPLSNCSVTELGSVDRTLIRALTNSNKNIYAKQSSGTLSSSILDFHRRSTWGRCYDLLASIVAMIGWDNVLEIKSQVFSNHETDKSKPFIVDNKDGGVAHCENWLQQTFVILFEDLKTLMAISSNEKNQQHSAIEWGSMGLLGWSVKYNLRESISAIITSVMGTANQGGFDYFGTVKLLEIYDEFILSEIGDTNIDSYHDNYDLRFFSNKLILSQTEYQKSFIDLLEQEYLPLDFVLLNLMKLISWNLRWYQYTPNYLVMRILTKLIMKYDSIYITTRFKIVYEQNKSNDKKKKKQAFSFVSLLVGSPSKSKTIDHFEFVEDDTIMEYVEKLIEWVEGLK
jgi:tetratricopeptide (TPR) repeat protein